MAESKDFNDVLDDIFLGEESQHKASYEEGFKAGSEAGNPEGYHLGYHRGAELGRELDSRMLSTIQRVQAHLDSVTTYLRPLLPLANCHMVEFFTHNHWETLLPENLRTSLEECDLNDVLDKFWEYASTDSHDTRELNKWISSARSHYLSANNEYCLTSAQLEDRITSWGGHVLPQIRVTEFMTSKKSYEVSRMSHLVGSLFSVTSCTCCVEAGGGRGHLLTALCLGYLVPGLSVDCSRDRLRAATARLPAIQKQWHAIAKRIKNGTEERIPKIKQDTLLNSTDCNKNIHSNTTLSTSNPTAHNVLNSNHCEKDSNYNDSKTESSDNNFNANLSSDKSPLNSDQNPHNSEKYPQDCAKSPQNGDKSRQNVKENLHRFAIAYITEETDLASVAAEKFPELNGDVKLLLTGLHTCGDLGPASLRMFTSRACIGAVLTVPCCYHLLTDHHQPMSRYIKDFKLCRNSRMLAAQSIDRVVAGRHLPAKSLLYRALLQELIKTHLPNDTISEGKLKRLSKCDNFHDYFKMADAVLNLGLFDRLPQSCLTQIYSDMDRQWRKLVIFYLLRLCLAQVVESVILLDRLLYLLENDFDKVYLVKLFEPVLSPRCYGIVAVR